MPSVQASVWIEASRSFLPRGTLVEIICPARVTLPLYNTSHDRGLHPLVNPRTMVRVQRPKIVTVNVTEIARMSKGTRAPLAFPSLREELDEPAYPVGIPF
jgi:hypothetical protein